MSINRSYLLLAVLLFLTLFSGWGLSSSFTFADDSVVDEVSITVPVSCTFSGIGTGSHNATLNNGTYNSNIGTTTLKAFCNDKDGFSIYAIGYTDNTDGKNVLASVTLGSDFDIATGTATSGNSQWAMKLATDSNATYPIELQNGFGAFHTVPDDYTLVAKRDAGTDVGSSASGSTLTTTYQIYVSSTQPTDYYNGQVKYVMVHPNDADRPVRHDQIAIVFDGNGLTFQGGDTENRVVYGDVCTTESSYIGNTPTISKTTNIANDGTMNSYNSSNDSIKDTVTFSGADKLMVRLTYGYDENGGMYVFTGVPEEYENIEDYEGDDTFYDYFWSEDWEFNGEKTTSVEFTLDSDTVTFLITRWDEPTVNYYGYHAEVYPIYNSEQPNTTAEEYEVCSFGVVSGTYKETTTWNGYWYTDWGDVFADESEVENWIREGLSHQEGGVTIHLYSANSYTIRFDANGGSGMMAEQVVSPYDGSSLNANTFVLSGKRFNGWNTKADGTGSRYTDGEYLYSLVEGAKGGGSVTLYAMWGDCQAGNLRICYDDNGANSVTRMDDQSIYSSGSSVMLWASNYQREGYGFAGWNTKADGTGTSYGPNETIEDSLVLNSIEQNGMKLYAMWVPSAGNLQNWSGCSGLGVGRVTALTDLRDNNTYAVAKLADGKCWMIENLRLDYTNSDNSTGALSQGYGGQFVGLAQPETANFTATIGYTASTVANSLYYAGTQSGTATVNILQQDTPGYRMPRFRNDNTNSNSTINPNTTVANMTNTSQSVYSYGNYYSWAAAKASTEYLDTKTNSDASNTSLCPLGWRFPTGTGTGDFGVLSNSLGGYKNNNDEALTMNSSTTPSGFEMNEVFRRFPNNFLHSGEASGSSVVNRGFIGSYWSATAGSRLNAYYLYLEQYATVGPGTYSTDKYKGKPIRCIIDN
ncbi:InlB B-repeat-containing protein [Candidatus Saccharibacteria bacterium]|nr:InlB B-repeat-containing protein [Candidatus Saccharibacteria bacterium]